MLGETKRNAFVLRFLNSSPPQNVSEGVGDLFILVGSVITNIHSRYNKPPIFNNGKCCFLIRETSDIAIRNLLKETWIHSSNTFFCCHQGVYRRNSDINDYRDCSAFL